MSERDGGEIEGGLVCSHFWLSAARGSQTSYGRFEKVASMLSTRLSRLKGHPASGYKPLLGVVIARVGRGLRAYHYAPPSIIIPPKAHGPPIITEVAGAGFNNWG